jgi:hypothetical protein
MGGTPLEDDVSALHKEGAHVTISHGLFSSMSGKP